MLYTIYMPRIAAKLVKQGFPIVKTELNEKNPDFLIYKFEDSDEFKQAISKIFEEERG